MTIQLRLFQPEDFEGVTSLLDGRGLVPPPEVSDLNGVCLLAEDEGKIVGMMWAIRGTGTKTFIDYWAIDKAYEAAHVGSKLVAGMDVLLKSIGIKRYGFNVSVDNEHFLDLISIYGKKADIWHMGLYHHFHREL